MKLSSKYYLILLLVFISIIPAARNLSAQNYIPVSTGEGLYCIVFPDGSIKLGKWIKSSSSIEFTDPEREKKRMAGIMRNLRQRIKVLNQIIRRNDLSRPQKVTTGNWQNILKLLRNQRQADARKKKANQLKKNLSNRIKELTAALRNIEKCEEEDDTFLFDNSTDVYGARTEVDTYFFKDMFGEQRLVYGQLMIAQTSNRKRSDLFVCLSRERNTFSSIGGIFPKEKGLILSKNPCSGVRGGNVFGVDCSKWFQDKYGRNARGLFFLWYLSSGNAPAKHILEQREKDFKSATPLHVNIRKKCRT